MTTHPIIDRLASLGSEQLTVLDVVFVLGHNGRKITDGLIASGELEAQKGGLHVRRGTDAKGRPIRHRSIVSASSLLIYLVRITSGDRLALLEAIRLRFPHHLPLCARIAQGAAASPAILPDNVVPMHAAPRAKRGKATPTEHPGQLLLFPVAS